MRGFMAANSNELQVTEIDKTFTSRGEQLKASLYLPTGPKKMVDRMKQATYISLPMNHFEPYVGEPFEKLVKIMGDFLKTNLKDR